MSNWIETPQGTYIAEDGGYLMCVHRVASAKAAYAYNTVHRDGTYNRTGDGYTNPMSAMVAAEMAMREHQDIRTGTARLDVLEKLKKERDEAQAECRELRKAMGDKYTLRENVEALQQDLEHMRKVYSEQSVRMNRRAEAWERMKELMGDVEEEEEKELAR